MHVAKWGNSLAVRLPTALVKALGIAEGDDLELQPKVSSARTAKASVEVEVVCLPSKTERLQAMHRFRSPWPDDFSFDREEANQR